jgi:hypothetical protein
MRGFNLIIEDNIVEFPTALYINIVHRGINPAMSANRGEREIHDRRYICPRLPLEIKGVRSEVGQ